MSLDSGCWSTLNRIKLHLHVGLSDTTKDSFLEQLLNGGYKILEDYIGYPLLQATYTEYYDGDDSSKLILRQRPLVSVTSIYVDSFRVFDAQYLADSGDYYVDTYLGIVEFFKHDGNGPGWFYIGIKNVKVTYVAGYVTISNNFAEILDEYVAYLFNRSGTEGFQAQSMGSKSETYEERWGGAIPDYIKWKLAPFKSRGI